MPVDNKTTGAIFLAIIIIATLASAFDFSEPEPKINSTIEDSKAALEMINEIRIDNGSNPIDFDERAYWLALHQCKDMEKYNYVYHTNPETLEWVASWKEDYGFTKDDYPVDNIYFNTEYTYADYNQLNIMDVSNEANTWWIESPGHYFNIMYPTHRSGAVVVYRDTVIFIGVNTDGYGSDYLEPRNYEYWEINKRYYKGY